MRSYAFSHCSAPRAPLCQAVCVEVGLFQVHSLRRSRFGVRLGEGCFVQFGVAFAPLSRGWNCRFLRVLQSVPWPDRYVEDLLKVGPAFRHKFPWDCPNSYRLTFAIKIYSLDYPETDEYGRFHPVFGLRSISQRTHSLPHSFPKHASAMWCPRPYHRSNGTFPSDPTVSTFSNMAACPILQAMVFDSNGICIWQLNSS